MGICTTQADWGTIWYPTLSEERYILALASAGHGEQVRLAAGQKRINRHKSEYALFT